MAQAKLPTFFLSHGGGPWPWMRKEMPFLDGLHASLREVVASLPETPKAIAITSGHWEEEIFSIMSSERPSMIYDYYGFPKHTYEIKYPAAGMPELAEKIAGILKANGIASRLDSTRGFDHGVYSLLFPMFPNADIPVVQISLRTDFSPKAHFEVGHAMSVLREEGVLIIGSGNLFHNLEAMHSSKVQSEQFDAWIRKVLLDTDTQQRNQEIMKWEDAPFARYCHPREDHLVPLFVALGAASDELGHLIFGEPLMGKVSVSNFRFG